MTTGDQRGRRAETLAAWYLRLKGYRILERRYKCPVGEIDIIARRGRVLVFVEVKARQSLSLAVESIRPQQRDRILRAAQHFMARTPAFAQLEQRVDALCLVPRRLPVHMHNICPA